jgi:hypothetical protein
MKQKTLQSVESRLAKLEEKMKQIESNIDFAGYTANAKKKSAGFFIDNHDDIVNKAEDLHDKSSK